MAPLWTPQIGNFAANRLLISGLATTQSLTHKNIDDSGLATAAAVVAASVAGELPNRDALPGQLCGIIY